MPKYKTLELRENSDTWSYTILGNDRADELWDNLFDITYDHATPEEFRKYHKKRTDTYPHEFYERLVKRAYDDLIKFVFQHKNPRLAFQVLGVFILGYGAKMPEDIRKLILAHSKWEDELDQIDNEEGKVQRKKYLLDFQERVRNYVEGTPVRVPHETWRDVYKKSKSRIRLYLEKRQSRKNMKNLFKK